MQATSVGPTHEAKAFQAAEITDKKFRQISHLVLQLSDRGIGKTW